MKNLTFSAVLTFVLSFPIAILLYTFFVPFVILSAFIVGISKGIAAALE